MRVSEIELVTEDDSCLLQAKVSSPALGEPFTLWYRFPAAASRFISDNSANPWVAALLLPAMKAGESLKVPVPISRKILRSLNRIQAIHRAWHPTLPKVEVKTPLRTDPLPAGTDVGLFFSCGLDSWHSLLRNTAEGPLYDDAITQLIVVHGFDIDFGEWKKDVFAKVLANTRMIAEQFGKRVFSVATNVRYLYTKLGLSWHWAQGGAIASVGLAAETMFKRVYIASGFRYANSSQSGLNPLFDPLWSTEYLALEHDGYEGDREEKIRLVAQSELAMETLRVCWANDRPEYNCGQCSKCLRAMLGLHIVGAVGKCRTLPSTIDTNSLRNIRLLFPSQTEGGFQRALHQLGSSATDTEIRTALAEGLAQAKVFFEHVESAQRSIAALIPLPDPFILVDDDALRFELSLGRRAIPFLEHDGLYYGRPTDDATAIRELERLREAGAKFVAFWREAFWWLDYYTDLNRHLRSTYPCILESDSLVIFDLRNTTKLDRA